MAVGLGLAKEIQRTHSSSQETTVMIHLVTRVRYKRCVVRTFPCVNIIERAYIILDDTAHDCNLCAILLYDWQPSRFVYTSLTTDTPVTVA